MQNVMWFSSTIAVMAPMNIYFFRKIGSTQNEQHRSSRKGNVKNNKPLVVFK